MGTQIIIVVVMIIGITCVNAERSPRVLEDEEYEDFFKLLMRETKLKHKPTPREKKLFRLKKSGRYRLKEYSDPISRKSLIGIVSKC